MSKVNYDACTAGIKRLHIIEGAGHGLAFPVGRDSYLNELRDFFDPIIEAK